MEGRTQTKLSEKWARTAAVPATEGNRPRPDGVMGELEDWRSSVLARLLTGC